MLVKLDVAIKFDRFATSISIFFSSFRCYASFFLLFRQVFQLLFDFVFHLQLVFSHKIFFLYFFRLNESIAS